MKELESKKERIKNIELCSKWIKGNLTIQDLKNEIDNIDWLVKDKLPEMEQEAYPSTIISILIDDVLEMDSISDKEKDDYILSLYETYKEELPILAKRVIKQIVLDGEEFIKYAKEQDYCPSMIRDMEEDQEELRLIAEKVLNNINS